ncbi:MAG: endonuclease III, partial [Candidatus Marinimicrobia bacterium]|nr:endonuclease III [Candidatus Neomarinimicrobiota bacterium]
TGFFNNKAKNILACCKQIVEKHKARVPSSLEELTKLPGVGRKTANVVLGEAFHIPGVIVDTHVGRLSRHLGLTSNMDPTKVEFDLMKILDKEIWILSIHLMIDHGRAICKSRKPACDHCGLRDLCPGPFLINKI